MSLPDPPTRGHDSRRRIMPSLSDYGTMIASTTIALRELLSATAPTVTTRTLDAASAGVTGLSVNLFLYRDSLISYRDGSDPTRSRALGAELAYIVSVHSDDAADTGAASHVAFGAARAAIENSPVHTVPITGGGTIQVTLTSGSPTINEVASLWLASGTPMRLSFGLTARFELDPADQVPFVGSISDVISRAHAGMVVVFSGPDSGSKPAAAAAVAASLGKVLLTVPLDRVVSGYIAETEKNLADLFDSADRGGGVTFIDEADELFGTRDPEQGANDRYPDGVASAVLEVLTRSPGTVIIAVRTAVGTELSASAAVDVPFPPLGR